MQAITRGWVVQVTPVHESSSPRDARFCFEFYTVTGGGGGGGGIANEQLGPACAWPWGSPAAWWAAGATRCQVGGSHPWRMVGRAGHWAQGGGAGRLLGGQESGGTCSLHQHS